MYSRLEYFPNELLFSIFEYLETRDLFHGLWNLNKRINQLLQSLDNLSLTIEKDETKLISLFASRVTRLVIDTCLNINLTQFPSLHSLVVLQLTSNHLSQICSERLPHLVCLTIPSDSRSNLLSQLIQRIFSRELSSLRQVTLNCLHSSIPYSFQSYSLHSVSIWCYSSVMVLYILAAAPNLSRLHVHFEENNFNIFVQTPILTNHPLKYFSLSDPFSLLCFKHIDTFLKSTPNVERIELKFNCDVPFIRLAELISSRLLHLRRFDCQIDNAPYDDITSIELIQQIHPCFHRIGCTIDDHGYRTYQTKIF